MFRKNARLLPIFHTLALLLILLPGPAGIAGATDGEAFSPEVEINRSVLDDLDGYTPPPMFGTPDKPVLSRPLKHIPTPTLTTPRTAAEESPGADGGAEQIDGGLPPDRIEDNRRRGLSHPIIEETPPPRKTVRAVKPAKKTIEAATAPDSTPPAKQAPETVAAGPVPPVPGRKPPAPVATPIAPPTGPDTAARSPEKIEKAAAPVPPPAPATQKSRPSPTRMPALAPVQVEQETLEKSAAVPAPPPPPEKSPASPKTQLTSRDVVGSAGTPPPPSPPTGDITAYDARTVPETAPIAQPDISASKAPVAPPDTEEPLPPGAPEPRIKPAPPQKAIATPGSEAVSVAAAHAPKIAPAFPETAPETEDGNPGRTRVDFAKGRSDLDAGQSDILGNKVLKALKGDESRRIQIQAYATASDQGQSSARRISLLRALSIRAWLVAQGVDPRRIDVRALGDQGGESGGVDRVDLIVFDPRNPP